MAKFLFLLQHATSVLQISNQECYKSDFDDQLSLGSLIYIILLSPQSCLDINIIRFSGIKPENRPYILVKINLGTRNLSR